MKPCGSQHLSVGLVSIGGLFLAGLSFVSGSVTYYPALDQNYVGPANTAVNLTTGSVSLDPATGVFVDPNTNPPDSSLARYYGGTFTYTPGANLQWGGFLTLTFDKANASTAFEAGKTSGSTTWEIADWNTGIDVATNPSLDFVIKVSDINWNVAQVDIFLGS